MPLLFIENSPYLGGVPQHLQDEAGRQYIGLMNEVTEVLGYHCPINEGVRSKADQRAKLAARRAYEAGTGPWAPVAASPLYTSNHDESRAGAADVGGPGGRSLSAAEHALIKQLGPAWGWEADHVAGEPWHLTYVGVPAVGGKVASSGWTIHAAPTTKTLSPAVITLIEGADTMPAPDLFHVVTTKGDQQYIADTDYESVPLGADDLAALEKAYDKSRVQINEYDRDAVVRVRAANSAAFDRAVAGAVHKALGK
jgi:hypothetical protein